MARTARVAPVTNADGSTNPSGWRVIDVSDPDHETEVSRHETEPEAVKAARDFEGSPEYTVQDQEGEGEEDTTYTIRQVDAPGSTTGTQFEVYNAVTGDSLGFFASEDEARQELSRLESSTGQG